MTLLVLRKLSACLNPVETEKLKRQGDTSMTAKNDGGGYSTRIARCKK